MFITFEGTEGVGKSTLVKKVASMLRKKGKRVIITREPGGTPVAEKIRKLILDQKMDPWTELFLYEASRAEHLAKKVRPALNKGVFVLCDRFTDSSLAYQAHARGLPWNKVKQLNELATLGLKPRLTVWIDLDPKVGLARATVRTRFEKEGLRFQQKVRAGFIKARKEAPRRWLTLQAKSATPNELAQAVIQRLGV